MAFGGYDAMKYYCSMYKFLETKESIYSQIISEELLHEYLLVSNNTIHRIDIPYTLLLSQCFTISICGDSASEKTSLARLIQKTLHFDKTLLFETDRYHKWERGVQEYQHYSHLHPAANHLEELSTDAYKLSLDEDVFLMDYYHSTGTFTESQCVEAKHFTIFCGWSQTMIDDTQGDSKQCLFSK